MGKQRDPSAQQLTAPDPRLPELFAAARDRTGADRESWLAALRADDSRLADDVAALLAAEAAGHERFAAPMWESLGEGSACGATIGPYRLEREIGRGGMARVYLAVQEGPDFRRTVALKLLDRPVVAEDDQRRFRDEVRILASLEHPGIARFLDGGRSAEGAWFLALEYVEGEDLISFARTQSLDLRRRVELFLQVVEAVDFAHRRLVVHRDLKPGNVLVGADGRAKLLDFGISKILEPERDDVTRTGMQALTPAYASPEQLRGERVTIAADVYSLGVMLYELLVGRRPGGRDGRPPFDRAAFAASPAPPSTAARGSAATGEASGAPTPIAWRDLAGDLDAIAMKALRFEPESRYRSAAELGDDLRRWLAGEPVAAHRGGRRYRFGKLVRRHRLVAGAAALAALGLLVGGAVAVWQARIAGRERDQARAAESAARLDAIRAQRITDLLGSVFDAASPYERPGPIDARELLAHGASQIATGLEDEPELRAQLAVELGEICLRLGEAEQAAALVEPAVADLERLRGAADPRTASGWNTLARVRRHQGRNAEARSLVARALIVHRAALGPDDRRTLETLALQGNTLRSAGDFAGARQALEEAVRGLARLGGSAAVELAKATGDLGLVLQRLEDWEGAERHHRRAHALLVAAFGPASPRAALSLANLAEVLDHLGRDAEARVALEEVLRVNQDAFGAASFPGESVVRNTLAWILLDSGAAAAARDEFRRAIAAAQREHGAGHAHVGWPLRGLAETEVQLGRLDDARATLESALALRTKFWGREHWEVAQSLDDLARVAAKLGDADAEGRYLREALEIRQAVHPRAHPDVARATLALARYCCTHGLAREGGAWLAAGLELARPNAASLASEIDAATTLATTCPVDVAPVAGED